MQQELSKKIILEVCAKKKKRKKNKFDDSFLGETSLENAEAEVKEIVLAQGVVIPDIQAEILSVEEKKKGLAGVWQSVSQSMIPAAEVEEALFADTEQNINEKSEPEKNSTDQDATDAIPVDPSGISRNTDQNSNTSSSSAISSATPITQTQRSIVTKQFW